MLAKQAAAMDLSSMPLCVWRVTSSCLWITAWCGALIMVVIPETFSVHTGSDGVPVAYPYDRYESLLLN